MKRLLLLLPAFCILLATICIPSAHASVLQLPKTGQTTSYGAGDDGELQVGLAWPTPRFVDNGDQTVTDKLTGLIWAKDANLITSRDPSFDADGDGKVTFQSALDYIQKLNSENYQGHSDWRLPNIKELLSLVHRGESDTAIWLNGQGFSNVEPDSYWSSSSEIGNTSFSWHVYMNDGMVLNKTKNGLSYVWPVRLAQSGASGSLAIAKSGQTTCYNDSGASINCSGTGQDGELQSGAAWPTPRFSDNGDGTVTDNLTGLIWSKDGKTPGPASCGPGVYKTWSASLDHITCLNTNSWLGKTDWRLPNLNEQMSLVNYGQSNSATWLISQGFSNVQDINYGSSTSDAGSTDFAWFVSMLGGVGSGGKTFSLNYVWPVRTGQSGSPGASASLSITNSGSGSGTVTSSPSGINCGSSCSASFTSGQSVTLTATADTGSAFASWTGCDSSSGDQCTVTVTGTKSVSATFNLLPPATCGSANGVPSATAPATNLCGVGTASAVTAAQTTWNWTCSTGSGTPATCLAGIVVIPATTIQLPQTGQNTCYDVGGEIPCAGTGQDGDKQAGKPWPNPRFTDNNNGTVTDNLTGLVWLQNPNCTDTSGGIAKDNPFLDPPMIGSLFWNDALIWSKNLGDGICGLTDGSVPGDWRLPNLNELHSLVDRGQLPMLDQKPPFTGTGASVYWSSNSSHLGDPWVILTYYAYFIIGSTQNPNSVWPVRDGQPGAVQLPRTGQKSCMAGSSKIDCTGTGQDGETLKGAVWPVPRFHDNGNGTVTDKLTGLIWTKNANCNGDPFAFLDSQVEGNLTWPDALAYSSNLASGSCGLTDGSAPGDWRLPNINELQSLVDLETASITEEAKNYFNYIKDYYWSSTTDLTNQAFWVQMEYGTVGKSYIGPNMSWHAWPVRGGQLGDASMSCLPASMDFATLQMGESGSLVLTIGNTSATSRLQVNAMTLYGTDAWEFSLDVGDGTGGTCGKTTPIISAGDSCTVSLNFNPITNGTKTAKLRISTSDAATPEKDIPLNGAALINGTCGTSNGGTFNTAPSSNLCTSGTASTLSGTGPWAWNCNGVGGTSESCSAAVTNFAVSFAAGEHGSLTGTTSQTINYGGTATTVTATPDPTYSFVNWTEGATVVGTNATLTVSNVTSPHSYTANFIVNYGVCGTSNGGSFPTAPASNLCMAGTATVLSGTGPWSWQCVSAYGGATANCSANIRTYTVTPSAGTSIVISPATPVTVNHGAQVTFTIAAPEGYGITGTGCGGTLSGTTYTSGVVTADCTVNINTVRRTADAAGSGQPTLQDAMKAFHAYNGKLQLSAAEKILYDVAPLGSNGIPVGNSVVDYADIIMIMRRIVGIGSW